MAVSSLQGSVLYNHFTHEKLERSEGNSITEGTHTLQSVLHTICGFCILVLESCLDKNHNFLCITDMYVGIGRGRVTDNLNGAPIDSAILVKDSEAVAMV